MTCERHPSHQARERLNAYVDGELTPDQAAAVAAAVAADPALADEVARLTQLKWTLQSGMENAPAGLLPPPPRRRWRPLLAACLGVLLFLGAGWAVLQPPSGVSHTPEVLLTAVRLHARWASEAPELRSPEAGRLLAAVHDFGHPLLLPDLSDNQLQVARVVLSGEDDILHIGYRGTRGCQVSLFAFRDARLPAELRQVSHDQDAAYLWRVGPVGYALLADGMSSERLRIVARAVEEATRSGSRLSPETRTALADSRARSEPCLG